MNIQTENKNRFTTSDLALAATLITCGYQLLGLDKTNPKRNGFIFCRLEIDEDFEKTIEDYFDDKLEVSPRIYFNNIKLLKDRIYSK